MHPYLPQTEADLSHMLKTLGLSGLEDLFSDIDDGLKITTDLDLPEASSEKGVMDRVKDKLSKNTLDEHSISFAGAGMYQHTIPSIVPYLISRSEFATAYTPYQPEISQGTLQSIFEYQTMITRLTGMYASNASHYDGATATAEAVMMAHSTSKGSRVLVSQGLNPESLAVIETYCRFRGMEVDLIPLEHGLTPKSFIEEHLSRDHCACVIQSPNYLGQIEDLSGLEYMIHSQKGLLIVNTTLTALGILEAPGHLGADICVGDGQSLGNPMHFGGPSLGFMATTKKLMRKLPGRIVGHTTDLEGRDAYVLTLQAREQHIRRDKATSNITSNQALNALATTITLGVLGPDGLEEMVLRSMANMQYFCQSLSQIPEAQVIYKDNYLYETLVQFQEGPDLYSTLIEHNMVLGIYVPEDRSNIENTYLIAITEVYDQRHIDAMIDHIKAFYANRGGDL